MTLGKNLLMTLTVAGGAVAGIAAYLAARRVQQEQAVQQKKTALQRWEDDGGPPAPVAKASETPQS